MTWDITIRDDLSSLQPPTTGRLLQYLGLLIFRLVSLALLDNSPSSGQCCRRGRCRSRRGGRGGGSGGGDGWGLRNLKN